MITIIVLGVLVFICAAYAIIQWLARPRFTDECSCPSCVRMRETLKGAPDAQ